MDSTPEYLPHLEWDFSMLKSCEANLAFFYEYARESKPIREKATWLRSLGGYNEQRLRLALSRQAETPLRIPDEFPAFLDQPFSHGIGLLSDADALYPETAFLGIEGNPLDHPELNQFLGLFASEVLVTPIVEYEDALHGREAGWAAEKSGKNEAERIAAREDGSIAFAVSLPLDTSLRESMKAVMGKIESHWSRASRHHPRKAARSACINGKPLRFQCESALDWLGVLRRFEHHSQSWSEFIDEYGFTGDVDDFKRSSLTKANKAREILKWFDALGQGEIASAKNLIKWIPDQ